MFKHHCKGGVVFTENLHTLPSASTLGGAYAVDSSANAVGVAAAL